MLLSYPKQATADSLADIFLVDSPLTPMSCQAGLSGTKHPYLYPTLRFPYAGNRGGLLMPRFSDQQICSPMKVLVNAFEHQWQIDLIFSTADTFPNVPLLYLLSNSTWETRYRELDKRIKAICLREIRHKGRELVDLLHDLREDLSNMRVSVEETIFYAAHDVQSYFSDLREQDTTISIRRTPIEGHQAIKERADHLHNFFTENIQLLLGIISIRDAQHSIEQTHKSTILTALATIYLPLSLATGIFGMNVQEMTGTGPRLWLFAVVCAAILVLTSVAVLLVFKRPGFDILGRSENAKGRAPGRIEKFSSPNVMEYA